MPPIKSYKYNTTRPIIVRFIEHSDRELIWKNVSEIPKNSYYFINEDYPKSIVFNRKKLLPVFVRARKIIGKHEVSLSKDQLTISGRRYTVKTLMNLKGELNPRSFSRKTDDKMLVFGGVLSEYESLSNWGKYPVKYNDEMYPTLEHAYMHIKCITNGDVTSADAVLRSCEPYQAKQIGEKIVINEEKWSNAISEKVMSDLLEAKFAPGTDLAKDLLATGSKYLAESGRNQHYACGLSITHKDILNKATHTGRNRLGHLLMDTRQKLNQAI